MDESIFTKESVEKKNNPNNFSNYVKVVKPSSWIAIFAIIVFIVGFIVWTRFSVLDITLDTVVVSRQGFLYTIVQKNDIIKIDVGREVRVDNKSLSVSNIGSYNDELKGYIVYLDGDLEEGTYDGLFILDSINAWKLYFN